MLLYKNMELEGKQKQTKNKALKNSKEINNNNKKILKAQHKNCH